MFKLLPSTPRFRRSATALAASTLAVAALQSAIFAHGAAPRADLAGEEASLNKAGTYIGQFTLLGNGTVRSWARMNKDGSPSAIGVTFSATALQGLSNPKATGPEPPSVPYTLTLPEKVRKQGFDHVGFDWNPQGHPPKPIYDKPHFDVHFYMTGQKDRDKITLVGADLARSDKKPQARYMPQGYMIPPETAVPRMGSHAVDMSAPELHGKPFGATFIYGFYNGQMTFVEPMVSLAFLQSKQNMTANLKLPQAYPRRGYYPTRYSVRYDAARQEYTIALEGLTLRGGTVSAPKTAPKPVAKVRQVSLPAR